MTLGIRTFVVLLPSAASMAFTFESERDQSELPYYSNGLYPISSRAVPACAETEIAEELILENGAGIGWQDR
jgi:hypothetical protein